MDLLEVIFEGFLNGYSDDFGANPLKRGLAPFFPVRRIAALSPSLQESKESKGNSNSKVEVKGT
jgi:hypothetical protein